MMGREIGTDGEARTFESQATTLLSRSPEGPAHTHPSKRPTDLHRGAGARRGAPVAALGGGHGC